MSDMGEGGDRSAPAKAGSGGKLGELVKKQPALVFGILGGGAIALVYLLTRNKSNSNPQTILPTISGAQLTSGPGGSGQTPTPPGIPAPGPQGNLPRLGYIGPTPIVGPHPNPEPSPPRPPIIKFGHSPNDCGDVTCAPGYYCLNGSCHPDNEGPFGGVPQAQDGVIGSPYAPISELGGAVLKGGPVGAPQLANPSASGVDGKTQAQAMLANIRNEGSSRVMY